MKQASPTLFHDQGALRPEDFQKLANYIHSRTGIRMPSSKLSFLEGRLRRRLRALGFDTFTHYCNWLFNQNGMSEEETELVNVVTTNKTDFFREPHHFDFLTDHGLPELIAQGRGTQNPLRLWSAGCSNGAEPYTLAMVCQEFAEATPGFRYEILASDLSTTMLNTAARAIYPHAEIEPVPMELRKRYLLRDTQRNEVRIAPLLRNKVNFSQVNLTHNDYGIRQLMDIVFCRNLLIYFDKPTQQAVLQRLCNAVRPGGYVIIGHSESIAGMSLPLRPLGATVFLRENG
ncbi:MAG: hypothetical protein RIR18_973 [Pseudomonadota bacterium]|jgi:chemotaxis protein methyltransferase CheR